MEANKEIENFLSNYDPAIVANALKLRATIMANLPGIIEQVDIPAKMIAYCYGQKYSQLICVIIPSKAGLKLGFNKGIELPDPENLLEGNGKISRYVKITSEQFINSAALRTLLSEALIAYKKRIES